jgi:hypothetical protein
MRVNIWRGPRIEFCEMSGRTPKASWAGKPHVISGLFMAYVIAELWIAVKDTASRKTPGHRLYSSKKDTVYDDHRPLRLPEVSGKRLRC